MTEFTSEVKTLPYSEHQIFEVISDFSNLERVKDRIPHEKIQDFSFDTDSCTFSVNPVGKITLKIIEREPYKTVKLTADPSPIEFNMWIQLKEVSAESTKMKLTVKAELNPFIKAMVAKPIQEGLNKVADVLAAVPYNEI